MTRRPAADLTLAELEAVLALVLATGYEGVRSGRVRDLPDARTIRWYQTLGIVDRPAAFRGRTALFTGRHVLQVAAIKRLQAAGHPLADIQRGLAGKTAAELARIGGTSVGEVDRLVADAVAGRRETRETLAAAAATPRRRADEPFWASRPGAADAEGSATAGPAAARLQSIDLGGAAALVWTGLPLTASDRHALARLARPLVEFLSSRTAGGTAEPAGGAGPSPARPEEQGAHP